ncbi:uncharacterized protein LOC119602901 [Lucilia sericata]|uniref:uncharacterized protein LOC119602901 n=1 Tax=Lucilia sericata TaxID=13632 RepID=UPI0018A7FE43|nr:uncharacterized protein LOC119602901 [Lucilia sericata]
MEKFIDAADEFIRFEARLKEEDFSVYTLEALDFEKSELNKLWEKFKIIYETYVEGTVEKKEVISVQTKYSQIHKTHVRCINILARAKRRLPKEESSSKSMAQKHVSSMPVQACDVEVFDGDYASWPTFRDLFTTIYINNDRLGPVEKLCYLFQKTSGDAREVNRNITVTSDNFNIAWENLKATYENKRILFNNQMNLLYNLAPCQDECASEIKRLQREINNCISTLRLPEQTLNLWEQSVKNKAEIPKWKEINDFLTDRFRALESVFNIRASGSQPSFQIINQNKTKHLKAHHTKVHTSQCKLCKGIHDISSCSKFLNMDYKNCVATLRKFRFCFNCLKLGHMFGDCPSNNGCSKCKRKHHNLLHRDFEKKEVQRNQSSNQVQVNNQPVPSQSSQVPPTSNVVQNHHHSVSKKVLLATAWVNIVHYGSSYKVRALIDPCSDESFISEKIQKLLKLPTVPVSVEVVGLGGEIISRSDKMANFSLVSLVNSDLSLNVTALVVPQVTGNVPTHSYNPDVNIVIPKLEYADPGFYKSGTVDMLLGGDVYPNILRGGVKHGIFDSLVAQETMFGWIVTGPTNPRRSVRLNYFTKTSIDDQLTKFWELEEISRKPVFSEGDKLCEEIFRSTTKRNADGRQIAVSQFLRNENSLLRRLENKTLYDEVLNEYLTLAHMEKIETPVAGPSYYLPHHGVFKSESTTTKLRVVFNASSITSSDISKMYRQILINPEQTRFQQIVYRGSPNEEIKDYRLKTVTFGVNCAPYLALRTLLKLADDEEHRYPVGATILRDSMYVDDALVGAHCLPDVIEARNQLIAILDSAGFQLRKWTSNMKEILVGLPTEDLLNEDFLSLENKSTAKTLGVHWNASADYFYFTT